MSFRNALRRNNTEYEKLSLNDFKRKQQRLQPDHQLAQGQNTGNGTHFSTHFEEKEDSSLEDILESTPRRKNRIELNNKAVRSSGRRKKGRSKVTETEKVMMSPTSHQELDLLMGSIASANTNRGQQDGQKNKNSKTINFLKGLSKRRNATTTSKEQMVPSTEKIRNSKDESSAVDTCDRRVHDPSAASQALLTPIPSVSFSPSGALMSSAIGLSLLHDPKTNPPTAKEIVRESLERHIRVCLDHCGSTSNSRETNNVFANTSLPVDVDELTIETNDLESVDEVALQHVADGEPNKALEIFLILLQNQRNKRGSTSCRITEESDIANTKSRLVVLSLLIGNTHDALQYTTSALQTQNKAKRPVHTTLLTMELGLVYFGKQLLNNALRAWREALQLACMTLGYDRFQVAILLNNIGCLHFYLGNVSASLRALEESLGIQRQILRCSSQNANVEMPLFQMANTMANLALISAKCNNYDLAIGYLEESIAVQESIFTTDIFTIIPEKCLGRFTQLRDANNTDIDSREETAIGLLWSSTDFSATDNSILQPLSTIFGDTDGIPLRHDGSKNNQAFRSQVWDDDHICDSILLGSLVKPVSASQRIHATVANSLGRVARSVQHDNTLLETDTTCSSTMVARKKQSIPVDLDGESVIDAEFHLKEIQLQALSHICRNEFKDALDLFESALRSHKDKYGEIHHLIGTGLHNCGIVHMMAEQYSQARLCFQEAINVRIAALGNLHPDVSASMFQKGMIQIASGDLESALTTFMDIVSQLQKNTSTYGFAPEAKMLNNIGVVLYEMGRDLDAFQSCHKAYEIQKGLLRDCQSASTVRALASTLGNLGFIYAKQGQYDDALFAFKEALAILLKHYPADHTAIVTAEENIAHVRAYGAVDGTEPMRHAQSNIIRSCVRLSGEKSEQSSRQSKITACFHFQ